MRQHYPLNSNGAEDAGQLPWTDGVPSTGAQGSYPGHAIVTDAEAEILSAIDAAGLSRAGSDLTQLVQAIARGIYLGGFTGSANALSAPLPNSVTIPALLAGMRFIGRTSVANTGAATMTLTGFGQAPGTLPLLGYGGGALKAGDLPVGSDFDFRYDGAAFRAVVPVASEIGALAATSPSVTLLTPAGAKYAKAFTPAVALSNFAGGASSNTSGPFTVAQSLTVAGASYMVIKGSVALRGMASTGTNIRARLRTTVQGGSPVLSDWQGCRPYGGEQISVNVETVLQGLDRTKSVLVELVVDRDETGDVTTAQDPRINVQHDGN